MNDNRLMTTLGYYVPSFYSMFIGEGDDKLDINKLNDHDLSVFFHEYIHFLQDLTTFDGANRSYCFNELLKAWLQVIYADKAHTKVPIALDKIDERVLLENMIVGATAGDNFSVSPCEVQRFETIQKTLTAGSLSFEIPIEMLGLDNHVCYKFGSIAIQESMAYLMQQQCTKIDYTSPDAPYNIATKLAYGICPEVFCDGIKIVALCDAALMSNAPGLIFRYVAQQCKANPDKFKTPESIIDFTLQLEGKERFTKQKTTIEGFYFDKIEIIKNQLKGYIDSDILDFSESFEKCISLAIDYRRNSPYFMVDIARGGYVKTNKTFIKALTEFGTPLIVNSKGLYHQAPSSKFNNGFMMFFSAILQMRNLFLKGMIPCNMKNWCVTSGVIVDERCDVAPWSHCVDSQLCPYGFFWKHRNLSDYTPV